MSNGVAAGLISVTRKEPGAFAAADVQLLRTFADQAVIAIENVRLFDEVQARTRDLTEALEHQTATSEVLSAISRSPTEVQPVFDAIARSATELCGATSGGVDLFYDGLVHLAAHYNWSPEALDAMRRIYPAAPGRGFASARAILTRSVVHIPDISKDPEYTAAPVVQVGFRSVLAVPMLRDGAADRRDRPRAARAAPIHRSANRASADLRRTGGDRHQQRAPVRRGAGADEGSARVAGAADGHGGGAEGHQPLGLRSEPRHGDDFGGRSQTLPRSPRDASPPGWRGLPPRYPVRPAGSVRARGPREPNPGSLPPAFSTPRTGGRSRAFPGRLERSRIPLQDDSQIGRLSRNRGDPPDAGRRAGGDLQPRPSRPRPLYAEPDQARPDFRRSGGDRDRERAHVWRSAGAHPRGRGGARAADRDRRGSEGHQPLGVRPASGVRYASCFRGRI